ncbi:DUF3048 domain-containing protein [Marmoricola endophyticus]|nr:DUF3048 domain-containing protein [Marmoricola endophyticus]
MSHPRLLAPALVVALALGVSACGKDEKQAAPEPSSSATPTAPAKQYWPLTGQEITGALPTHPPVAVKIDNTESSQPQIGLNKADLITEELVEGGMTRLAVFFDTTIPRLVGPVRSMRASDIGLVKPVKGVVVTSGAAPATISRLKQAKVNFKSNDAGNAKGFYRAGDRTAPYNLMMRLPDLVRTLAKPTALSQPYLPWSNPASFAGTAPATSVSAQFGGSHTTRWALRGQKYVNTNSNAAAGTGFKADTIVVVRVTTKDAGYRDPAGNYVPESVTTGGGNAAVFHGGKALVATWAKKSPTAPFTFTDAKGAKLGIPAGHTFVEVLPRNDKGGRLTYSG